MRTAAMVLARSGREVEAAEQAAVEWLAQADDPAYVSGAIAGYAWALGEAAAPISNESLPVTVESVRREERLADDAIYDRVADMERGFVLSK